MYLACPLCTGLLRTCSVEGNNWPSIGNFWSSLFFSTSDMTSISFAKAAGCQTKLARGRSNSVKVPGVSLGKAVTWSEQVPGVLHLLLQQIFCGFDAQVPTRDTVKFLCPLAAVSSSLVPHKPNTFISSTVNLFLATGLHKTLQQWSQSLVSGPLHTNK